MKIKNKILNGIEIGIKNAIRESLAKHYQDYSIYVYFPNESEEDDFYVRKNKDILFKFLNDGYKAKGFKKFDGCLNKRNLWRNAKCVKVAKDQDDEILAVSVYSGYLEGLKCVGIAGTLNPLKKDIGKDAAIAIIKQDIVNWKEYQWCECSDVVERYYEKFGAIHIPAEYAPIFGIDNIEVIDEYHYERYIAQQDEPVIKTIYGFNSEETFNQIMKTEGRIMDSINILEDKIENIILKSI